MPDHTCRILDFSPMDQIHFVTLRKYVAQYLCVLRTLSPAGHFDVFTTFSCLVFRSVIEKPFYRYHDLQAGQIVQVRAASVGLNLNLN